MVNSDLLFLQQELANLALPEEKKKECEARLKRVERDLQNAHLEVQRNQVEQAANHNLLRQLSQELREREKALKQQQEKLLIAEQLANSGMNAKSQFLSNMSHEIRTPLNGILGMIQLLGTTDLDEQQQKYAHTIRIGGESLLGLIDQILDFAKIEAGQLVLDQKPFHFEMELLSVSNLFLPITRQKEIGLSMQVDERIPKQLIGDQLRIRQVLNNLIGNAIKFTEIGGVNVRVLLQERKENAVLISYEVEDSGIGISKEQQAHLFQAFNQVDNSYKRKFGGTGLGLSISQEILQLMGSKIEVVSEVGKGSHFSFQVWMSLPASEEPVAESLLPKNLDEVNIEMDQEMGQKLPLKILLVEDNELNQIVAQSTCTNLGYEPDLAINGREAVKKVLAQDYDIILMDLQMPEMDGYEATNIIRWHCSPPRVQPHIIAMTANVSPEEREKCKAAGMDDFLGKPFSLADFQATLVKWGVRKELV
jgi:signal transduction histidine kinase/ActR/RegA family two-component response regulator